MKINLKKNPDFAIFFGQVLQHNGIESVLLEHQVTKENVIAVAGGKEQEKRAMIVLNLCLFNIKRKLKVNFPQSGRSTIN